MENCAFSRQHYLLVRLCCCHQVWVAPLYKMCWLPIFFSCSLLLAYTWLPCRVLLQCKVTYIGLVIWSCFREFVFEEYFMEKGVLWCFWLQFSPLWVLMFNCFLRVKTIKLWMLEVCVLCFSFFFLFEYIAFVSIHPDIQSQQGASSMSADHALQILCRILVWHCHNSNWRPYS